MANTLTKARPNESRFYYHFIKCGFYSTSTSKLYIPLAASDDMRETTSLIGMGERVVMICPFDGNLETVWVRSEEASGNTTVGFHHNVGAGSEVPGAIATSSITVALGTDDTSYEFDFTSETNTFSQGDIIMFSVEPTNALNDVHFMIVLKFNVTT